MRKGKRITLDLKTLSEGRIEGNLGEVVLVRRGDQPKRRPSKEALAHRIRNQREEIERDETPSAGIEDSGGGREGEAVKANSPGDGIKEDEPATSDQSENGEGKDTEGGDESEGGE